MPPPPPAAAGWADMLMAGMGDLRIRVVSLTVEAFNPPPPPGPPGPGPPGPVGGGVGDGVVGGVVFGPPGVVGGVVFGPPGVVGGVVFGPPGVVPPGVVGPVGRTAASSPSQAIVSKAIPINLQKDMAVWKLELSFALGSLETHEVFPARRYPCFLLIKTNFPGSPGFNA